MAEIIEEIILSHLLFNDEYTRKILPYVKEEYFHENHHKIPFQLISKYLSKYNALPTKEALNVDLEKVKNISEKEFDDSKSIINSLEIDKNTTLQWLVDKTEEFCKEKALYNAISKSIKILDDPKDKNAKHGIPKLLQDALGVSFQSKIGHDYIEDAEARFDYYHTSISRIPFEIDMLNKVTNGGTPIKTLNLIMGGVNIGKTTILTNFAASNLKIGKNVLYITLEMSEEEISKRIDENLLDVSVDEIETLPKNEFLRKIDKIRNIGNGKLLVYEFPTSSAGAAHFRYLLNDLKLKKNFIPDIIYIDYINICCSSRFKSFENSYGYVKSVSEEIRGLSVETGIPIWSAVQFNRGGYGSSDPDMDDVADSFGLNATADFILAVVSTDELEALGQYLFKQLKNRYRDKKRNKRFVVGVDIPKQRLYNVEQEGQNVSNEVAVLSPSNSTKKKPEIEKIKITGFK